MIRPLILSALFLIGAAVTHTPTEDPFAAGSFYTAPTAAVTETPSMPSVPEGMVLIPAGTFTMGADENDPASLLSERPAHSVELSAFALDEVPVTNGAYAECVAKGICYPPQQRDSATRRDYYNNPDYADYPVIHVTKTQAEFYCREYMGKRLPTEAEWEKAARGTDGRTFPWADENILPANIGTSSVGDTSAVRAFPAGASPYGVLDMFGNVWEWTADVYDEGYYHSGPTKDPVSVDGSSDFVLRGLAWSYPFQRMSLTIRGHADAQTHSDAIGFRCAMSVTE